MTSGDVDGSLKFTLAAAAARVEQAGGKVELHRDRLVVVSLPPGSGTFGTGPLDAARVLYLAEATVVAALTKGEALPDAPVTPSGFVLGS